MHVHSNKQYEKIYFSHTSERNFVMGKIFENVKGTYDYLPEKQIIREQIKSVLQPIFVKYGFAPIETPILCTYELLASKYSEGADILNEIYKVRDQGRRQLGLRYDLTITFSKLVSSNPNITLPFKRYEIGRVYRDGPVKLGRNREFTQCDIDVVGTDSMMAEAEYMMMIKEAFDKLELDVEIEFNNRKLLVGIINEVFGELNEDRLRRTIMLIDKFAKLSKEELLREFQNIDITEEQFDNLTNNLSLSYNELKAKFANCDNELISQGLAEIGEMYKYLDGSEAMKCLLFTPHLARGIDIYTGMVWEIFLAGRKIGDLEFNVSIGGGGRFDKIITTFVDDGNEYPAVGMSFGLDAIYEVLVKKNEGKTATTVDVYVIPFGENDYQAFKFASQLRMAGARVEIDKNVKKLKKSLNYANKQNIPFVIILGEDEFKNGVIKVKRMTDGQQEEFRLTDYEGIAKWVTE